MTSKLAAPARNRPLTVDRDRGTLRPWRVRPAVCARLAGRYERIVDEAVRLDRGITARIPVQRVAIRQCESDLLEIASRLRTQPAPGEDGVRAARRLLTDGAGPLYANGGPAALRCRVVDVLGQL